MGAASANQGTQVVRVRSPVRVQVLIVGSTEAAVVELASVSTLGEEKTARSTLATVDLGIGRWLLKHGCFLTQTAPLVAETAVATHIVGASMSKSRTRGQAIAIRNMAATTKARCASFLILTQRQNACVVVMHTAQ